MKTGHISSAGKPLSSASAREKRRPRRQSDVISRKKLDEAVTAIETAYLSSATLSIETISDKVLKAARRLTGSRYGFVAYLDPATGWMVSPTMTRAVRKKRLVKDKSIVFKQFGGLWGRALKYKKHILTNNASVDPRLSGAPKGHIKIEKFMAAPAVFNKKLIGMVALANGGRDYTADDLAAAKKLARVYAIIIQRKFAEEKLKESAANQHAVINSSKDIIYTVNAEGIVTYMSPQAGNYGYSPGEIVGRHVLEFAHPDDRDFLKKALANALKTGHTLPILPYRIKKKDGSYFYAEQKSGVIMKNGKPSLISCVVRDVTERKRLENRIKESEEKYRTLFENANASILLADAGTGMLLDANRRAERLFGRTKRELIGMHQLGLHPPNDAEYYKKYFQDHIKRRTVNFSDAIIVRKDGTRVLVQISAAVTKINGKKVIQGIFEDITERRWMENIVKENEEILRRIFDATTDAVFVKDTHSRYVKVNKACADIFLLKPEEVPGKTDAEVFPRDVAAEVLKDDLEVLRTGKTVVRNKERTLASGKYYFNTIKTPLRNSRGEITGVVGVARDITKIKKIESELALARALEAVSLKTGPIAHDFNNALAAINGYATLIDDDLDAKNPIKPEITMIIRGVKRAAKITAQLQKYARNPKVTGSE